MFTYEQIQFINNKYKTKENSLSTIDRIYMENRAKASRFHTFTDIVPVMEQERPLPFNQTCINEAVSFQSILEKHLKEHELNKHRIQSALLIQKQKQSKRIARQQ